MTASTQAAPKQVSFGRLPAEVAAMALAVIFAIVIAIVALNTSTVAAPATVAKAAPPPAAIDHGTSNGELSRFLAAESARLSALSLGGWGGPRVGSIAGDSPNAVKVTTYGGWTIPTTHHGRHPGFRPQ
jgi:hypothetical protein